MTPGANGGVNGTKVLGEDPTTGLEVSLRGGRFGPYLQLGETSKEKGAEKPKRAGLPKGLAPDDIDLEKALALLALPREVGIHPEDGVPIVAGIGRFGPYVKHGKTYANIDSNEDVLTVGLNRAVTLIAEKKANPGRGRRFGADPGKVLGEHPDKGGPITVKNGRYGPYVSHAGINATLPGDKTPDTVTLDEAVGLLEARIAKGGGAPNARRAAGRKAASGKKAASPAATPKKSAAAAAKAKQARRTKATAAE
jgi:DNA topoisomerase-1